MSIATRLAIATDGYRGGGGAGIGDADFCVFSPPEVVDILPDPVVIVEEGGVIVTVVEDVSVSLPGGDVVIVTPDDTIVVQQC